MAEWQFANKRVTVYHSSDLDKVSQTTEWHLAIKPTFPKWPNGNSHLAF